jgi:hypothetical protein
MVGSSPRYRLRSQLIFRKPLEVLSGTSVEKAPNGG